MTIIAVYLLTILLPMAIKRPPDRYESIYPFGELEPMMSLAEDSIFNVGTAKELDKLPNIGVVLSNRIIEYREIWGNYRIPEDLVLVKGIGKKTLDGMMEMLDEELVPWYPSEQTIN